MCEGHGKSDTHPSHCGGDNNRREPSSSSSSKGDSPSEDLSSYLLELAAANDVQNFQKAVEQGLARIDGVGNWYVRQNGSKRMSVEQRTPAMVAASYGSIEVLRYIVKAYAESGGGDINRACGSDGTTALHCAVAGCSEMAVEAAKLLVVEGGADAKAEDANGRKAEEMIRLWYKEGDERREAMEEVLKVRKEEAWRGSGGREEEEEAEEGGGSYFCDYFDGGGGGETYSAVAVAALQWRSSSSSSSSPKSPQVAAAGGKVWSGDGGETSSSVSSTAAAAAAALPWPPPSSSSSSSSPKSPQVAAAGGKVWSGDGGGGGGETSSSVSPTPAALPWQSSSSSSSSPKSPQVAAAGGKLWSGDGEKAAAREYPADPSLPDIKNSIYSTDEFRMYTFKVRPCSRAYSHDWTECPFVHPGENARRRDPRRYHYSCVPCPDFRKGSCRRADSCEYAHGVFECWLHPAQYRTRLCKDGTDCNRRVCFFAHTSDELRSLYISAAAAAAGGSSLSPKQPPPPPPPPPPPVPDIASSLPSSPGSPLILPSFPGCCLASPPLSPQPSSPNIPSLQLPPLSSLHTASRLRTALNARDFHQQFNDHPLVFSDPEGELLGGDYQDYQSLSVQSLSTQARLNAAVAAASVNNNNNGMQPPPLSSSSRAGKYRSLGLTVAPSNLDEMFASSESISSPKSLGGGGHETLLSQFEAQMQSPAQFPNQVSLQLQYQAHQAALEAQLQGSVMQSPKKSSAFSHGPSFARMLSTSGHNKMMMDAEKQCFKEAAAAPLSPALAAARAAFAQRERHSYSSRDLGGASLLWSDWGSPTGKPEWSVQGDDLCKLRKSASMGVRVCDEPDLSWVQTLVKEGSMDGDNKETGNDDGTTKNLQRDGSNEASSLLGSWIDKLHLDRIMA